ncbi:MAG: hypothetical protein OXL37_01965 [Chloroflexota bacterium]|nr:hypothetical protein [Chloroflexota bacterium]MDE2961506.1 hypothetical protein [Chloroflexota bacterium]
MSSIARTVGWTVDKFAIWAEEIQCIALITFEAERALVSANRELVERMEGRIAAAIRRVWYDQAELLVH